LYITFTNQNINSVTISIDNGYGVYLQKINNMITKKPSGQYITYTYNDMLYGGFINVNGKGNTINVPFNVIVDESITSIPDILNISVKYN